MKIKNIKELSLASLEDIYFNNLSDLEENEYLLYLEDIIMQLQGNKPIIQNLYKLHDSIRSKSIETEISLSDIYNDILKIEVLYYEDFIHNIPIKYYSNKNHISKNFSNYLDKLVEENEIHEFTKINIDYNIMELH